MPRFAEFMISRAELDGTHSPRIVELGVGSGQQTEFVERELLSRGISEYRIFVYDRSYREDSANAPGQLNVLVNRIADGELSERVVPVHLDFDGASLPLESDSIDLVYMAHVLHHVTNKQGLLSEIGRVIRKGGKVFILGVALESLRNHPFEEFFPTTYEYEVRRYPTLAQLKAMLGTAGFTYESPLRIRREAIRPIDREMLVAAENATLDSVLPIMKAADPAAYRDGLARLEREVDRAEESGNYRTCYSGGRLRVFWGVKE